MVVFTGRRPESREKGRGNIFNLTQEGISECSPPQETMLHSYGFPVAPSSFPQHHSLHVCHIVLLHGAQMDGYHATYAGNIRREEGGSLDQPMFGSTANVI